jgi:hypothetical protein
LPGIAWVSKKIRVVIPAITISWRVPKRSGLRVKWKTKTKVLRKRQEFTKTIQVPKPVIEKKFAPTQRFAVAFRGGAAFDESGRFGFYGEVSVVIHVCGFRKKISGSLKDNEELVGKVRDRVARIEDRIDKIRGLKPARRIGSEVDDNGVVATDDAPQLWYHIKRVRGDVAYHLLIPAPQSEWMTPRHHVLDAYANIPRPWPSEGDSGDDFASPGEIEHLSPLAGAVTSIRFDTKSEDSHELLMPWDRHNLDAIQGDLPGAVEVTERLLRAEVLMLEGAATPNEDREIQLRSGAHRVVSDPRLESAGNRYVRPKDRNLPAGVIFASFRDEGELLSELERLPVLDDEARRLLLFLRLSACGARMGLENPGELDATDRCRGARVTAIQTMISELDRLEDAELFAGFNDGKTTEKLKCYFYAEDFTEEETRAGKKLPAGIVAVPRRRNLPLLVKRERDVVDFELTLDILDNCTNLSEWIGQYQLEGKSVTFSRVTETLDPDTEVMRDILETLKTLKIPNDDDDIESPMIAILPHLEPAARDSDTATNVFVFKIRASFTDENTNEVTSLTVKLIVQAVKDVQKQKSQVGLIFQTPKEEEINLESIEIVRDNDYEKVRRVRLLPLNAERMGVADDLQDWLAPLEIRQDFIATKAEDEVEIPEGFAGVLQISLPVKLREDFVRDALPAIKYFRLFRHVPGLEEQCIADRLEFPLEEIHFDQQTYLLFSGIVANDTLLVEREGNDDHSTKVYATRSDPQSGELVATHLLFTREGASPLGAELSIRYSLQPVSYGDDTSSTTARVGRLYWERGVVPYVPAEDRTPPDLTLVVKAADLTSTGRIETRLVRTQSLQEQSTVCPDDYPYMRLWTLQSSIVQNGFYADGRSSIEPTPQAVPDRFEKLKLDVEQPTSKGKVELVIESYDDKGVCTLEIDNLLPGQSYQVFAGYLRAGVARVAPVSVLIVRELPTKVGPGLAGRPTDVLELIDSEVWNSLTTEESKADNWEKTGLTASPREFRYSREKVKKHERGLSLGYTVPQAPTAFGGIEFLIRDIHESSLEFRVDGEVLQESIYRAETSDFRNPSLWQIPPRMNEKLDAIEHQEPVDMGELKPGVVRKHFVYDDQRNPALQKMREAYEELADDANLTPQSEDWTIAFSALSQWHAVADHLASTPLQPATAVEAYENMRLLTRCYFLGIAISQQSSPENPKELLATLNSRLADVDELSRTLSDGQITATDDQRDLQNVGDLLRGIELVQEVADHITERLAVASAVFDADEQFFARRRYVDDSGVTFEDRRKESLPRWGRLAAIKTVVDKYLEEKHLGENASDQAREDIDRPWQMAKELLGLVNVPLEVDDPQLMLSLRDELDSSTEDYFVKMGFKLSQGNVTFEWNDDMLDRLVKVVPQAAGLTAATNAIKSTLAARSLSLLRRPHHQSPAASGDPDTKISLSELLPAGPRPANAVRSAPQWKIADRGKKLKVNYDSEDGAANLRRGVVACLNVFECLGMAVDIAVENELGETLRREELLEMLRGLQWDAILPEDHQPLVIAAREPDADLAPDAAIGPSVVKLVVIPKTLLNLMKLPVDDDGNIELGKIESQEIIDTAIVTIPWAKLLPNMYLESMFSERELNNNFFVTGQVTITRNSNEGEETKSAIFSTQVGPLKVNVRARHNFATKLGTGTGKFSFVASAPITTVLEEWFKLRSVDGIDGKLGAYFAKLVKTLLSHSQPLGATLGLVELEDCRMMRPSRPIRDGRVRAFWKNPLRGGHDFYIFVRRVSRYEPLTRWASKLYETVPGPVEETWIKKRALRASFLRQKPKQTEPSDEKGAKQSPSESFAPRALAPAADPREIRFRFQSAPSLGRSLLSGVSRVRTGAVGIDFKMLARFDPQSLGKVLVDDKLLGSAPQEFSSVADVTIDGNSMKFEAAIEGRPDHFDDADRRLALLIQEEENGPWMMRLAINETLVEGVFISANFSEPPLEDADWVMNRRIFSLNPKPEFDDAVWRFHVRRREDGDIEITDSSRPLRDVARQLVGQMAIVYSSGDKMHGAVIQDVSDPDATCDCYRIEFSETPADDLELEYIDVFVVQPVVRRETTDVVSVGDPKLLRHEGILASNSLPYHLQYAMLAVDRLALEQQPELSTVDVKPRWTGPLPSRSFGVSLPEVTDQETVDRQTKFNLTLYLSRFADHLTEAELNAYANSSGLNEFVHTVEGNQLEWGDIRELMLLDPFTSYQLLYREVENDEPTGLFRAFLELLPPGHPDNDATKMLVRELYGSIESTPSVEAWRYPNAMPVYQTTVPVTIRNGWPGFDKKKVFYLQCRRGEFLSRVQFFHAE